MAATQVLDQVAIELSKPDGWLKGSYGASDCEDGAVCLSGAIKRVGRSGALSTDPACRALQNAISCRFPGRALGGHIPTFNDHRDTTLEDVLLVILDALTL